MRLRRKSEGPAPVRRILVGTDLSETATRAVRWAAQMAERYEAELVVCQSVHEGMNKAETQRELAEYTEQVVGPEARPPGTGWLMPRRACAVGCPRDRPGAGGSAGP